MHNPDPAAPPTGAYAVLHCSCAALGTRLFTASLVDEAAGVTRRAYTSDPVTFPVSGTKPLPKDGWYDHCITGRRVFVANTVAAFAAYFPDHALIASLGLGSCINIPVLDGRGLVLGTINLLAEGGHFTPHRIAAYQALVDAGCGALVSAMMTK